MHAPSAVSLRDNSRATFCILRVRRDRYRCELVHPTRATSCSGPPPPRDRVTRQCAADGRTPAEVTEEQGARGGQANRRPRQTREHCAVSPGTVSTSAEETLQWPWPPTRKQPPEVCTAPGLARTVKDASERLVMSAQPRSWPRRLSSHETHVFHDF